MTTPDDEARRNYEQLFGRQEPTPDWPPVPPVPEMKPGASPDENPGHYDANYESLFGKQ